jgi:hypothetical protein
VCYVVPVVRYVVTVVIVKFRLCLNELSSLSIIPDSSVGLVNRLVAE